MERRGNGVTHATELEYDKRNFNFAWHHEYVDGDYNSEVGYVPRSAYWSLNPRAGYKFFPKSEKIVSHGPYIGSNNYWNTSSEMTESETFLRYGLAFLNRSE